MAMDIDQLIADCAAAVTDSSPTKAVRETLEFFVGCALI